MNESRRGRVAELTGVIALLMLAFGGYVKGSRYFDWVPINITLAAGSVVLVMTLYRWQLGNQGPRRAGWLAVLLLGCLAGLIQHTGNVAGNTYAEQKPFQVFVIAPLCIFGGSFLLQTARSRAYWVGANGVFGLFVLLLARLDPSIVAGDRLATEGGNTIGAGRGLGAGAVVFAILAVASARHRLWAAVAAAACAWGAVQAASRGPLAAAAIAVLFSVLLPRAKGRVARAVVLGVGTVATFEWFTRTHQQVNPRLSSLSDDSAEIRLVFWRAAWGYIKSNPLGIGWGRLYDRFHYSAPGSGYTQYPHNLLLEVASESGWVAGAALIGLLLAALRAQWRRTVGRVEMCMFGLLVFALVNAMVSGDVNANRGVWVGVGAALAGAALSRPVQELRPGLRRALRGRGVGDQAQRRQLRDQRPKSCV